MIKKITLLLISLFIFSCTSSLGSTGIKFKDRNGTYQDTSKNITVTVTEADNQNLTVSVLSVDGTSLNDTYDITSAVTTGNFTLTSKNNKDYTYIINFYGNTSVVFSVRKGPKYLINNQELKNNSK
ncbi:hypothetical protein [Brachyspira hampsonii]|uniref:Lipoprotein n=1 Tax=Brachyspira hampsonii TaxID=1287055 RepID=A0AAC9TUA4_9SPIR|nr:hypothetical protein [Brachyspira hampsonii]ASJ20556.1 hypothetical protein BHAMNSH16_02350 [Brachyspira hampsonii]ELV05972.1 hypothetical protein H263_07052 [Brachyspira hampsonii 30599]MBW5379929.1 hypothetical protein [Brachyspira hampsonii]OEJ18336.1 hypothetical protein A9496_07705 [Brachyspira hampsonii]